MSDSIERQLTVRKASNWQSRQNTFAAQVKGTLKEVEIKVGDLVQWEATKDLVFAEICYPPYEDGRFENISE